MTIAFGCAVPLLLSAALLFLAQAPLKPGSSTGTINATIHDVDSGQPLSHANLQVQLFRQEHEPRQRYCVPSDDAQPIFVFTVTTNPNGSFSLTAPGGGYLAKITIPQRQPVFGCVFFDTQESVRPCASYDPRIHQYLIVRTANSIPGFSGDILGNSSCVPYEPQPCDPLQVPNLVQTSKIVLRGSEGDPIPNARLEFREYTKGKGKFVGTLMTDASGVADVSSLRGGLRMSIESPRASGEFVIEFRTGGVPGQQTIKLFHWHCRGNVMQGAMVQP